MHAIPHLATPLPLFLPCHTITFARSIIDTCKVKCGICHIHAALGELTELLYFGLPSFCLELRRTCFENVDKLIKYHVL